MFGESTWSLLTNREYSGTLICKRAIHIKHRDNAIDAYECDPLVDRKQDYNLVLESQRQMVGIHRVDTRYPVGEQLNLRVKGELGIGRVIDFSKSGFAVEFEQYLGKGVVTMFTLDLEDGNVFQKLKNADVDKLNCECRWGRPVEGKNTFVLGFLIRSFTDEQRDAFVEILKSTLDHDQKLLDAS
jgi:hypothetical protein